MQKHYEYVDNILKIAARHPKLNAGILESVIEHLCRLDHFLPKSTLLALEDESEDEETVNNNIDTSQRETFKTLDTVLIRITKHIDDVTLSADKTTYGQNLAKFLREFIPIFEKVLIPQPSTKTVQFVLFYLLSLKKSFPDSFCDWLLKRLLSPNEVMSKRLAVGSYLCGFLARAQYVAHSTLETTAKILSSFCQEYLRSVPESRQSLSPDKFMPFYIVTQALFYLIIFRKDEIGMKTLRQLNIPLIVFSKLNPLACCVPAIALKFCDIMKETEITFCHTVLEQTRQRQLLTRGRGQEVNPLDFYFPFDPCLLPEMAEKIDTFYNHWNEGEESDSDEDMDES